MRTNLKTVGILADDLTSAADGAAPFVDRGYDAAIGRGQLPTSSAAVLAIDSGSRSLSAGEAAESVARLTAELASRQVLYKTVDSTLRGHVKVELEAAFGASGRKMLVFAPAFPAAGRTTVSGVQLVDGVPVSETVYGRDPVHPARHSTLVDLVPPSIASVILLDATTQEELNSQIAALPEPESILWVGSPGMATALARRLAPVASPVITADTANGDVLVAIGSANPRSHVQADQIATMPGITLLRGPSERQQDPAQVLRQIADEAAARLRNGSFAGLIATGGDTMEAILDRLGVREFEILQELEPGFPLGRATFDAGRSLHIAMKAGGFGSDDTLCRAVARFRRTAPQSEQVLS